MDLEMEGNVSEEIPLASKKLKHNEVFFFNFRFLGNFFIFISVWFG